MTTSAFILLVDDDAALRVSLAARLRERGYEVAEAVSGEEALARVRAHMPDVVVLHAAMPDMSGHEVCVKLKTQADTAAIPVLLASPAGDRGERLRALAAGADDCLSRPYDADEAVSRIRNAIRMRALVRQAQDNAQHIKDLESVRDELTQLIVRDMRSPLAGLAGLLELADHAAVKHLDGDASYYLNEALGATETLSDLIDSLMDVRRIMAGELTLALHPCDLRRLAGVCVEMLGDATAAAGITVTVSGQPTLASCDEGLLRRVLLQLIRYAVKRSVRGQSIEITVRPESERVSVEVTDHGSTLTENEMDALRRWFRGERSIGRDRIPGQLGFTFCRLVVRAHGGDMEIASDARVTTLQVRLPVGSVPDVAAAEPVAVDEEQRSRRYLARRSREETQEATLSLSASGTRVRFAVAVSLMSVLPLLAFMYLVIAALRHESISLSTFYLVTPVVVVLVLLGMVLLTQHRRQVEQLRRYLEVMARGGVPQLAFSDGGMDFEAIEKSLGAVIRQSDDRIRVIEAQSRALVQAEQQRVMIETLGATCHHLGQPATVIRVYLEMMKKKEASPEMQRMIDECQDAAESVAGILQRLQSVATYQTEPYLPSREAAEPGHEDRILKI